MSDPPWGGSNCKAGQGVKETFKDKRLFLKCCHSGSGFGQIFQGVDLGWGKKLRKGFSFIPNIHSNIRPRKIDVEFPLTLPKK